MNLLYYAMEREKFPEENKEVLSGSIVVLFFDKLKSHYKFSQVLEFHGSGNGGNCNSYRVRVGRGCTLGTLAHEVAHAIQFRKIRLGKVRNTHRWHTKAHSRNE